MIRIGNIVIDERQVVAVEQTEESDIVVYMSGGYKFTFKGEEGKKVWKLFGGEQGDIGEYRAMSF
jgi:hypothetical protein